MSQTLCVFGLVGTLDTEAEMSSELFYFFPYWSKSPDGKEAPSPVPYSLFLILRSFNTNLLFFLIVPTNALR